MTLTPAETTAALPMEHPIAVLHLRDTDEIGGPGKTILETSRVIDPMRFRLHVAVFATRAESGNTPFVAAAREAGLPVHVIRGFNQYDPRLVTRLVGLVRRLGIGILHAHEVKSDVIACLTSSICSVPIVTTLHGWIGNSARQRLLIALDQRIARRFDRVIVVSSPLRAAAVAAGVSEDRLRLLHNAIAIEKYARGVRPSGLLAARVGPLHPPVVVSIGRLSVEKGHVDLVDAVAQLASSGCPCSAVIVGEGPERPALERRISELGLEHRVHLPGYIEDARRVLSDADLLVLPSHSEGLPNAALEALAMAVPVLATRVGGTPEVIVDGETGCLVPPGDPRALAAGIRSFVESPARWQEMAVRGRVTVASKFSLENRTRQLERLYEEVARRSR